MKIVILEGIATSGKSTIMHGLVKSLSKTLKVIMISEEKTHIPIIKRTDDLCIDFFKELITNSVSEIGDLLVFDRLYLTQAFRVNSSLEEYDEIENLLLRYNALTVFLRVDDVAIGTRVAKAMEHRDPSWGEYINTKGDSLDQKAGYYINQQSSQLKLLSQSKLPYQIFDTTGHNYQGIIDEISMKALTKS